MTTIVYHNGILASDSMVVVGSAETFLTTHIQSKIRLSQNKTFGYGLSGRLLNDDEVNSFELKVMKLLIDYELKKKDDMRLPFIELLNNEKLDSMILMTKKHVLMILMKDFIEHKLPVAIGLGTGWLSANVAIKAGKGILDAVELAKMCDPLSGGHVYFIKQDKLKPIKQIK